MRKFQCIETYMSGIEHNMLMHTCIHTWMPWQISALHFENLHSDNQCLMHRICTVNTQSSQNLTFPDRLLIVPAQSLATVNTPIFMFDWPLIFRMEIMHYFKLHGSVFGFSFKGNNLVSFTQIIKPAASTSLIQRISLIT